MSGPLDRLAADLADCYWSRTAGAQAARDSASQSVSSITAAGVRTSHTVTSLRTGSPMLRIAPIALAAVAVVLLLSALPDIKRYLRIRRM